MSHISGLSAGINSMMGANGSLNGSKIARTVIENSLLYDFLESAESKRGTPLLDIKEDYALSIPKDSMTYFATIAPLTEMMEGHQQLDNPDITMAISKMNSGIRNSKGYYEVVGEKKLIQNLVNPSPLKRYFVLTLMLLRTIIVFRICLK